MARFSRPTAPIFMCSGLDKAGHKHRINSIDIAFDGRAAKQRADETAESAIPCDYVDVVRLSEDPPRFLLQPHLQGGAVAMAAFTLEAESARGLVQHLKAALLEPDTA